MKTQITSLLLALPTCFTLACDLPVDANDLDLADASEQPGVAPSADAPVLTTYQHTATGTAAQIAATPAFAVLSNGAYARLGDVLAVKATMTAAELESSYAMLEHCTYMSNPACVDTVADSGFDPGLSSAEEAARGQLNAAFHLDQMTLPARAALMGDAQLAYVSSHPKPSPSLVPSTFENGLVTCDIACKTTVINGLGLAHSGAVAFMLEAPGEEGGGGGFIIKAVSEVIVAAGSAIIACLISPDCCLWPIEDCSDNECTTNNDCDNDEYCWKGPLLSDNECRSLKENGESCGHDYACESGCCNFNLFGSKCAVPNKCN